MNLQTVENSAHDSSNSAISGYVSINPTLLAAARLTSGYRIVQKRDAVVSL